MRASRGRRWVLSVNLRCNERVITTPIASSRPARELRLVMPRGAYTRRLLRIFVFVCRTSELRRDPESALENVARR